MTDLVRLSFSIEKPLHDKLEDLVHRLHYENRSEWEGNAEAVATITLIYNHHARRLSGKLTDLQHHHHQNVLAVTHPPRRARLRGGDPGAGEGERDPGTRGLLHQQKGVLHAAVSMSTTGKRLA